MSACRLKDTLHEKDTKANKDLDDIEAIFCKISDLQDTINALLEQLAELYVFGDDQQKIEQELNKLQSSVAQVIANSKTLIKETQENYKKQQNLVPSDIAQELTSLELLSEQLHGAMEEKNREFKRAKTVRTEYLTGVDNVQTWLHNAELRIQDRSMEPLQMKETLTKIHHEIVGIQERMDSVRMNGGIIMEKSRSDKEKELVQSTIDQLTQQLGQIRGWIDEKKQQVGDSLDAWTRFMNLYQIVMSWAAEKRSFVAEPMKITTLYEARQKLNDYSVSCTYFVYGGRQFDDSQFICFAECCQEH